MALALFLSVTATHDSTKVTEKREGGELSKSVVLPPIPVRVVAQLVDGVH